MTDNYHDGTRVLVIHFYLTLMVMLKNYLSEYLVYEFLNLYYCKNDHVNDFVFMIAHATCNVSLFYIKFS